ncbi:hypothetical protein [Sneathia sanguinegens]|jgi:hypothetical protein|uniref:hypothetical protein n=1 Tax=Sneathia sanguinegens TaxID=40543 RepID=UPI002911BA23|nr:hypothetical protein [Sneathia sanguinegens]MDU7496776.1 hypothetical protein [Sneathia sanguinegens]
MKRKQFDEFYFIKDGKIHTLDEVQERYEKNNGDISYFQGCMRCPECKEARLAFTHKTSKKREYLSKEPSSDHLDNCSYNYDYASKKQIIEYVETMNDNQIQDKLESALNMLMNRETSTNISIESQKQADNPFVIKSSNGGNSIQRTIPRKSLSMRLDEEYEGKVFIFYGKVKLKVEPFKDKEFFKLLIYTKRKDETWGYKTKVFRRRFEDKIDETKEYDIAILGYLDFSYGSTPEIKTVKFNSLLYR